MGLAHSPKRVDEHDERRASYQQPRIPLIGVDAGAIPGTKPGCTVRALEATERDLRIAGKELVRRKLAAARGRPSRL